MNVQWQKADRWGLGDGGRGRGEMGRKGEITKGHRNLLGLGYVY